MDAKFLEIAYDLKDIEIIGVEEIEGVIYITVKTKEATLRCSSCGSRDVIKRGVTSRHFKEVPVGLKAVLLNYQVQRLSCKSCEAVQVETLKIADKKKATRIM